MQPELEHKDTAAPTGVGNSEDASKEATGAAGLARYRAQLADLHRKKAAGVRLSNTEAKKYKRLQAKINQAEKTAPITDHTTSSAEELATNQEAEATTEPSPQLAILAEVILPPASATIPLTAYVADIITPTAASAPVAVNQQATEESLVTLETPDVHNQFGEEAEALIVSTATQTKTRPGDLLNKEIAPMSVIRTAANVADNGLQGEGWKGGKSQKMDDIRETLLL